MKIINHNMMVSELQEIPLTDRLSKSKAMICLMCSEHRPPKMSIPVVWYDEDFYINQTLLDAENELNTIQNRLSLATELIAVLSHNGMIPENMMTDGGAAWRKWQAEEMK